MRHFMKIVLILISLMTQILSAQEMVSPTSCVTKDTIFNVMSLECEKCNVENKIVEVN